MDNFLLVSHWEKKKRMYSFRLCYCILTGEFCQNTLISTVADWLHVLIKREFPFAIDGSKFGWFLLKQTIFDPFMTSFSIALSQSVVAT